MNQPIRFGILGAADIARDYVIPAMQQCEHVVVAAIASRNIDKARSTAHRCDIPQYYGSYEAMLRSPHIDAVYIPLPNHLHVPWSIKAIEHGKHVLCEKPIAPNASEAARLLQAQNQHPEIKVMEAFMYRFHPRWEAALSLLKDNAIGDPVMMHSFFCYHNDDENDIRNHYPGNGGGGLLDIGCYCVSSTRLVFGEEPASSIGSLLYDPRFDVDYIASGLLTFSKGTSVFSCSMRSPHHQYVKIFGTKGHIYLEQPFNPPADQPSTLAYFNGQVTQPIPFNPCNQFTLQADRFAESILLNQPVPFTLDDAFCNMKVLDALQKAGGS